ncbi:uncharacterized protein LOC126388379 [Xyrichtys novacula]|uniref:Uncharacterized protein LOC126388379 n=1 Tax=Xyrichtys novacula TaxID=13765 RepID=A0AAV1H5U7_XYRNO|nr:uncharacterized protein LOC126388379 [Xyrichtys novacula]
MASVRKMINQMLTQQKAHYLEMLDRQTDTFNRFVKVILDSTNERLDSMNRNIQEIKDSIHYTQREVDEIKATVSKFSGDPNTLENNMKILCDSLVTLDSKADYLESQSKRNNLIFEGIEESAQESWADTEGKVRTLISEKLKLDARAMPIERAHRSGKPENRADNKHPIIVKFLNYKDKELILKRRKELKKTAPGVYINEDFSEAVRQKRRDLMPKLREAWNRGDIAYLRYDPAQ